MRNGFLEGYNSKAKTQTKLSYLDKNKYRVFIDSSNHDKLISNKIKKLKNDIQVKSHNELKKLFKKNKNPNKNSFLRNKSLKTCLNIDTNFFNEKHFIREFENLFEHTTNNNIVEYFNGKEVEKMDDFVKRIKEYNYNNFIKSLKRKKSKNVKTYSNYKNRSYKTQPYNYKGCPYSVTSYGNNQCQNDNNNYSEYVSTACSSTARNFRNENKITFGNIMNNYGSELTNYTPFNTSRENSNYNFNMVKNKTFSRNDRNSLNYKSDIKKLKMFEKNRKFKSFSYNSRKNQDIDDYLCHYISKKNLNLNII